MPNRTYSATTRYRYGFNGKENDNESIGDGNQLDYGFRISNPRLGRFLSVDPVAKNYPQLTPYQFASNKPINGIDLDGLEWVLKIYDPQAVSDFLKAGNDRDLYKQRGVAYQAINGKLTAEEFWNRSKKNPGIVSEGNYDAKTNSFAAGELIYDKTAPAGLTFKYQTESKGTVTEHTLHWDKGTGKHYDDSYPTDIRATNSPEFTNFYAEYDFVANFSSVFGSAGKAAGTGTISGFVKGYGRVEYTTVFWGTSTPAAGTEIGKLTGNFNSKNTKDFSPSNIAGYGGSQGWGAGIAARSTWYSFATYKDMQDFNTAKATISGEQNAISMTISLKKLSGFSAGRFRSLTTLVSPIWVEPKKK